MSLGTDSVVFESAKDDSKLEMLFLKGNLPYD